MNIQQIQRQFSRIGARVKVHPPAPRPWWDRSKPQESLTIDIGDDASGEYFDITVVGNAADDAQVLDVQPGLRHLLLMSHHEDTKHKFLCGHDERHWFVAAVPERAAVSSVRTAFDALKPPAVRAKELRLGVKPRKRNRRRNEAFIRQGEWFFVPVENRRAINDRVVLRHEPISRGNGGKPHLCEEVVRQGGEMVYVCSQYPRGLTVREYEQLISRRPATRSLNWRAQRRNPSVFVRGFVRHPDHKTILLDGWHEVFMNTEHESVAMRHVAFID